MPSIASIVGISKDKGYRRDYGPRVHRSGSTFAAPLTNGQSLSASKNREAHMEYRR
jgi:hypothetical protein